MKICSICKGEDRGGVPHEYHRAVAAMPDGWVPLGCRSAIGVAFERRGWPTMRGPGSLVSGMHMAYYTLCTWVRRTDLAKWENSKIR